MSIPNIISNAELHLVREIPGFEIVRELAKGGMSTVYLAIQKSPRRQVALKVMLPSLSSADSAFKERFLNEGRIIARLKHPSIVTVYDSGYVAGYYYIAMEYIPGGNLKTRIQQGLELPQSVKIIKQIALALEYAHENGFVHRDIKPMNILLRDDGSSVLTDFGIAKALVGNTMLTQMGLAVGTPAYMSPEQVQGQKLDGRSDLYSLGIVFYEMLVGECPYQGENSFATALMHMRDPVPNLPPSLASLQSVLKRLLNKDPERRFRNSKQFIGALDRALSPVPRDLPAEADNTVILSSKDLNACPLREQHKAASVRSVRNKTWKLSTGIGVMGALVLVAGFWLREQTMTFQPQQTAELSQSAEKPDQGKHRQRLLSELLETDRGQLAAPRYPLPVDFNAHNTSREVPAPASGNETVQTGEERIAEGYTELAGVRLQQGDVGEGLAWIRSEQALLPDYPSLQRLLENLDSSSSVAPRATGTRTTSVRAAVPPPKQVTLEKIGTVVSIEQDWGFVVVRMDRAGVVKTGQQIYIKSHDQTMQKLLVRRISNLKASATSEGGIGSIQVGMTILADVTL